MSPQAKLVDCASANCEMRVGEARVYSGSFGPKNNMGIFNKNYKISVCIPVFGTEKLLKKCLESVENQSIIEKFSDAIEIIVVDDCSPENSAKNIVKQFQKEYKIPVNFFRHADNKGLIEARRTAIYAAKGKYIFNLDSDDSLPENALLNLYEKAEESSADIVQGKAAVALDENFKSIDSDSEHLEKYRKNREKLINNVFNGELFNFKENNQILDGYLIKKNHMGFLWGKLFLRETYLEAFNHIPPIECTMCEDLIQYVWICYEAKKYTGINNIVYNYSINTGISSRTEINKLDRWEKICSISGVFTALYQDFENPENYFTDEEKDALRNLCLFQLKNSLIQLKQAVVPELQAEAYKMLCDYWGADFVEKVDGIPLIKSAD